MRVRSVGEAGAGATAPAPFHQTRSLKVDAGIHGSFASASGSPNRRVASGQIACEFFTGRQDDPFRIFFTGSNEHVVSIREFTAEAVGFVAVNDQGESPDSFSASLPQCTFLVIDCIEQLCNPLRSKICCVR